MKAVTGGLSALLGLVAYGVTTVAVATAALPFGWYVEGNVGTSRSSSVSYGPRTSTSDNGFGWNLIGGYKFIPYFGAEVGYTNYADVYAKFNGTKVAEDSHYSLDIAGKGILPVGDSGVEAFAKFGIARARSHVTIQNSATVSANNLMLDIGTHTATSYFFGLGADYAFLPNVLAALQWQRVKGDSTTGILDLYSIGLNYIFS